MKILPREIADAYRFFFVTPKIDKRIVFYAEHRGYYSYFEGIIHQLITENNQRICYFSSDPGDPIFDVRNDNIKSFYFRRILPYILIVLRARVCVMTLTDLGRYHIWRSVNQVHYMYVFHSLVSTHMIYRESAFDNYDSILCAGPHQLAEIRRRENFKGLPEKKLVAAGYYRLERVFNNYQKTRSSHKKSSKKTVLIAPSWGEKNILELCGERLIQELLSLNYEVIVRPHPETIRRSPELIKLFVNKFGGNASFKLEFSITGDDSILRADILISDYSGIALEYAFGTERPVLFIDVPPKVKNAKFAELQIEPAELALRSKIGVVINPSDLNILKNSLDELLSKEELYSKCLRSLREKYVYNFGQSSIVSAGYLMNIVNNSADQL